MSYPRVIPRDLFNEAKLLKCMGRLALLVHDEMTPGDIKIEYDTDGFEVGQNPDDGSLTITNMHVLINDRIVPMATMYNSKDNYPLWAIGEDADYPVFTEDGDWHLDFIEFVTHGESA